MNEHSNYYDILDISPDASTADIQHAFREKVKLWHPDLVRDAAPARMAEAEQMMRLITEAYGVLGDPDKRTQYDADSHFSDPQPIVLPEEPWMPGRRFPAYSATKGTQEGANTFFALMLGVVSIGSFLHATSLVADSLQSLIFGVIAIITGLVAVFLYLRK